MSARIEFTPEQKAEMRKMRAAGKYFREIGAIFGCCAANVHRVCARTDEPASRMTPDTERRDWYARLAEIPRFDTRSVTGRICGDPLPERSALARRSLESA